MEWLLLLLGSIMVVVAVKLYLMFDAHDDGSIGLLSYWYVERENDLHFLVCPKCTVTWEWCELQEAYPNMTNEELDTHLDTVGLQCPVCVKIHNAFYDDTEEQYRIRQWIADSTF